MLTEVAIRALKATGKRQRLTDGNGLHLTVTADGKKYWCWRYSLDKKVRELALGAYPAVSLRQARQKAVEARAMLNEGKDPAAERKSLKEAGERRRQAGEVTFEKVAKEWFAMKSGTFSEKTRMQTEARMNKHVLPLLGDRPFAEVGPQEIVTALKPLEDAGKGEMTRRVLSIVRRICQYGLVMRRAEVDATLGLDSILKPKPQVKHRAGIVEPAELGALLRAIDSYGGEVSTRYALKLLPYLFLRSSELRGARWEEIDLERGMWVIPAARMKMNEEHEVPLARQVVALFRELQSFTGKGGLCFPSTMSRTRCITDVCLLNALRRLGYARDEVTVHGFRTTASTLLNEQGYRPDAIERQLAHKDRNAVRDAYNRSRLLQERVKMMQEWADYLDRLKNINKNEDVNSND